MATIIHKGRSLPLNDETFRPQENPTMSTAMKPSTIPVFPGLPILGNLLEFRSKRLELLLQVSRQCGDIGAFQLGPRTVVMLAFGPGLTLYGALLTS